MEFVQANLTHPGERLHKKKMEVRKVVSTGKNRAYDVGAKDVNDKNNSRNRDSFSITKSNNILEYDGRKIAHSYQQFRSTNVNETEDVLIEIIDLKNKLD